MQSSDTQSPSELERGVQSFGTEDDDHRSDMEQQSATAGPETPSENEKPSVGGINVSDWDGDDDPDNPYNCTFFMSTLLRKPALTTLNT
jgi:hypothetical protein